MPRFRRVSTTSISIAIVVAMAATTRAQTIVENRPEISVSQEKLDQVTRHAIAFLLQNQADDGSWSQRAGIGITGLAVAALIESGESPDSEPVQRGVTYLLRQQKASGGIHAENSLYRNYETAVAVSALVAANVEGRYDQPIENAVAFMKSLQWGPGFETDPDDPAYGGFGYGRHRRPDLSNTGFAIEALIKSGVSPDDPAIQRALKFVSRTQNLKSQHNNTQLADKVNDGGFYYTPGSRGAENDEQPAAAASSQAGETENRGLRSYGSMTYVGLKSMIYAGVDKDDIRVQRAFQWIRNHYTLEKNPGMEYASPQSGLDGLFYYYQVFGKALAAMQVDEIVDPDGNRHDWRADLINKMAEIQNDDGSFTNQSDRWLENDPNLVTSYVLLALANTRKNLENAAD